MYGKSVCEEKRISSDVQLKRLELAANSVASWTPWCSTASVFADKDVNAFLTQAADAFGARVAVSEVR